MFNFNIDVLENVVCLCPNCHARIHFSDMRDRKTMLKYLFEKKKDDLESAYIQINLRELNNLYQINS